jgi:Domain of unknown function (DUF4336)
MVALEPFAEDVWIVDGPTVRAVGIPFSTRMIAVWLSSRSWWVNSPVSVPRELLDGMTIEGPVRFLVAPTKLHVWRLESWRALFPEAELWAPPQVPREFKGLPFAGVLGDAPPASWAKDFDQLVFRGNLFMDEVYFLHRKSRTLIFGDFIQNHPLAKGRPLRNAFFKLTGAAWPQGGVPLDIRLSFTNRKLARQSLDKLLAWDFDKLILAHGVCVEKDAKAFVRGAFRWLTE